MVTAFTPFLQLIGALLTIATLSFLYKENPFYRWAEYTVIGVTTGNWLMMALDAIRNGAVGPLQKGDYTVLISVFFGVLYFSRYFGIAWLYRYPIALLTGIGIGLAIRGQPGVLLSQIRGVIQPITPNLAGVGVILSFLALVLGLSYFTYTREHKGVIGGMAKSGRFFIMAFIGMRFVGEVNAYVSILTARLLDLVNYILGRGVFAR